jgi:hypothetical protein
MLLIGRWLDRPQLDRPQFDRPQLGRSGSH